MKILEKKSVEVNFTESLLRMAADDVEGNQKESCLVPYSCWKAFPPNLSYLIKGTSSPSPPFPLIVIAIVLKVGGKKKPYKIEM